MSKFLMQVLWPSFLVAIVAEGLFFSLIDPHDLVIHGIHIAAERTTVYAIGFFTFWALLALSSALTRLLAGHPPAESSQSL